MLRDTTPPTGAHRHARWDDLHSRSPQTTSLGLCMAACGCSAASELIAYLTAPTYDAANTQLFISVILTSN